MEIKLQIARYYDIPDSEIGNLKYRCLEYATERFEECSIKGFEDIPDDTLLDIISDFIENMSCTSWDDFAHQGIVIQDYFNTIGFDFHEEGARDLVQQCVETILTDIDYEPKFKQLIELSDNLVTGYFDKEKTQFNQAGFNLYSQAATLRVRFQAPTKIWQVWMYDENSGEEEYKTASGWNKLIDYLCVESGYTWFMNMSPEQIQECKLWKERK